VNLECDNPPPALAPATRAARETAVLFADVMASAVLYELAGDAVAADAIRACLKALHSATKTGGGRVVKNIGDEKMMALFPSADRAAEAATRMHLAVNALPPIAGQKLALRIGFHVGPVVPSGDDFFGDTVNVAARLAAQATRGQVLIAASTVKKLSPLLRSSTRELYDIQVKGKKDHVSLCELLWSKSPDVTDFPLAQTMASVRSSSLRLTLGDRQIVCRRLDDVITIGRDSDSTFVVEEQTASRRHCTIERRQQNFIVRDHSSNGTYVSFASGGQEMLLRREEVVLQGRGWLAFGQPKSMATYVLTFEDGKEQSDGSHTE
jgi:adenylate cyclase